MQCVKLQYSVEDCIKKSRFIGFLSPCHSEIDVADGIRQLKSVYPDASHIAFAYRIKTTNGLISRFNDAGEPSGTAGKPIFQHLEGKDMINVLLAVIRYFGGVKLGAGGLSRAYGNTAKQVIEIADLYTYVEFAAGSIVLDYKQLQTFDHDLKTLKGVITEQQFAGQINLSFKLPKNNISTLSKAYAGLILEQI